MKMKKKERKKKKKKEKKEEKKHQFNMQLTITNMHINTGSNITDLLQLTAPHSSGAVGESRWPSWAVRPNEPSGFRGRKDLLNRASALVTTCP